MTKPTDGEERVDAEEPKLICEKLQFLQFISKQYWPVKSISLLFLQRLPGHGYGKRKRRPKT